MITGGHIFVLCLILLLIYLLFNKSKREKYEYKSHTIDVSWTNGDGTLAIVTKWIVVVVTPDGTEYTAETTSLEDRTDGSTANLTVNDVVLKPGNNKITIKLLFDDLYGRRNIQFYKYEVEKIIYDDYENIVKIDNFEGCYQGEWTNSGSCSSEGKQLQTRKAAGNCDDLSTERTIDCTFYGPWTVTDRCSRQGKLIKERTVTRGGNVTKEEQVSSTDCCYQTGWVNSGSCKSQGKQTQVRTSTGPCEDTSTTREIDCCYQTRWSAYGECKDGWAYSSRDLVGSCSGVAPHKKIRCDEMKFVSETWPWRCGDVDGVKKRCSMSNRPTYTKCNRYDSGYAQGTAYCERRVPYSWDRKTNLSEYNSLGGVEEISELP